MARLQKYDMEVRLLKVVKEQGLCKLIIGIDAMKLSQKQ